MKVVRLIGPMVVRLTVARSPFLARRNGTSDGGTFPSCTGTFDVSDGGTSNGCPSVCSPFLARQNGTSDCGTSDGSTLFFFCATQVFDVER